MKLRLFCFTVLAVTALTVPAALAEDPVALVAEGGTADGLLVESINNPAVNHSGGWAFNLNVNDGAGTLGALWGNASGGPGGLIRTEGTFPPYEQVSYESFWGMGAGGLACYSAISNNIDDGTTSLDGVWLDDSPVAVEEMVFPHLPDYWWSFGSRPGVTEDGIPYFVGGITETQGGSTATRGLFYGLDASPLILGGDVLPGLPAPISNGSSVAFDFRFSAYGTHYIAEVTMDTGNTADNTALVFDGEGLIIDGLLVQEGKAVPASAGGLPEENWSAFDFCGVSESGSYMFTGDTSAATTEDEFVVIDGVIVLREGMMIGDLTLSGSIEGAFMNENGDYAVIWDVDLPTGANVEALIFNGDVVLLEGDIIDTDGDGVPQPDCTLDNFTGIASLVLADRADNNSVALYFTADVLVPDGVSANPAGQVVRPDDAAGIDEEYTVEGDTRALVEYGYGLTFGGVVPTMLSEFDCEVVNTGVQISWRISGGNEADRLALTARSGDRTWDVPFDSVPGGRFTALDQVASGGEVIYSLMITGSGGEARLLGEQAVRLETPAAGIALQGAYPNPFNPETKITFRVGTAQQVQLAVYDLSGRLVTVLANEVFAEGVHQVSWNGRDQYGASVPSGTYFARTTGDQGVQTAKLMLVK